MKNKKILWSLDEKDLRMLDKIKDSMWLKFRNVTVSYLINRYLSIQDKIDSSDKIVFTEYKKEQ